MQHDPGYKLLFSHAQMVEDLLCGFVHEEWVQQLDFSTLEKVSGSYVSDDLRDREDDIIWRVRWGEEWLYVYLLLEFQSTVDAFMAGGGVPQGRAGPCLLRPLAGQRGQKQRGKRLTHEN